MNMISTFALRAAALGAVVLLSACGGGSDNNVSTPDLKPKPNAVTTPPTLTCSAAGIAASNASTAGATVCMLTSDGEIVVELETTKTPATTANFLAYVKSGFYANTIFHRVVPGFVVQGGGYTTGYVQKSGLLAAIKLESQAGLSNVANTIAMARSTAADSATSQFYFNTVNNATALDYASATAPGYAVFGRIISGADTVTKINAEVQLYSGAETPGTEVLLYWATQLK